MCSRRSMSHAATNANMLLPWVGLVYELDPLQGLLQCLPTCRNIPHRDTHEPERQHRARCVRVHTLPSKSASHPTPNDTAQRNSNLAEAFVGTLWSEGWMHSKFIGQKRLSTETSQRRTLMFMRQGVHNDRLLAKIITCSCSQKDTMNVRTV